jgi:DnaJ-class molecular chaperone
MSESKKKKSKKCPYCYGTGENPDMFVASRTCIMCNGTGKLDLTTEDVDAVVDRAIRNIR